MSQLIDILSNKAHMICMYDDVSNVFKHQLEDDEDDNYYLD